MPACINWLDFAPTGANYLGVWRLAFGVWHGPDINLWMAWREPLTYHSESAHITRPEACVNAHGK